MVERRRGRRKEEKVIVGKGTKCLASIREEVSLGCRFIEFKEGKRDTGLFCRIFFPGRSRSISYFAAAAICPDCSRALERMAAISSLYMICHDEKGRIGQGRPQVTSGPLSNRRFKPREH